MSLLSKIKHILDTPRKVICTILCFVLLIMIYLTLLNHYSPTSSDAFLDAYTIEVTPIVKGEVVDIFIKDNQYVQKGDPLLQIEPATYRYESISAKSDLIITQENLGHVADLENAHYLKAKSTYDIALYKLEHTLIKAPANGYITNLKIQTGTYANEGTPLMALVTNDLWWVIMNIKENNIGRVKPGLQALISIDMYPGKTFQAKVESIGWGVNLSGTPPNNYLPYLKRTNNWVQLAQRFPVKLVFQEDMSNYPLRVGATCIVTIQTSDTFIFKSMGTFTHKIRSLLQFLY